MKLMRIGLWICSACKHLENSAISKNTQAPQVLGNIPNLMPTEPTTHMALLVNKKQWWRLPKMPSLKLSRLQVLASSFSAIVLLATAWGILNLQAKATLDQAITLDSTGKYQLAQTNLRGIDSWWILPNIKHQATNEISQNQKWLTYYSYQQSAEKLASTDQKQALTILGKIGNDYPGYGKVSADIQNIQAALAKATGLSLPPKGTATTTAPKTTTKTSTPVIAAPTTPVVTTVLHRYTSTAAASSLAVATNIADAQAALQSFLNQYSLTASISSISPSSYVTSNDTFSILSDADLANLKAYGAAFIDEWSKYPLDWVQSSQVQGVAFVKRLYVNGTYRAATPDIVGHYMYYDVGYGAGDYAREVIHHEFDHLFTFAYFNSYAPSDPAWMSYNTPGFTYGNGGASAYNNPNYVAGEHQITGFVTNYSTYAIEEDKAELYAYLMTTVYYNKLKVWITTDSYLANKVATYKQFICSHSATMCGNYFDYVNSYN